MIEIVALYFLTNKIGESLRMKGYGADWFKTLTAGLLFGGELLGAIVGLFVMASSPPSMWIIYLIALAGAAVGVVLALLVTRYPAFIYRWWRVIASVLCLVIFLLAIFSASEAETTSMFTALSFIFISLMLVTILHQDLQNKQKLQAVLLGAAILVWLILGLGYAVSGLVFVSDKWWALTAVIIAMGLTVIAMLWMFVDAIRNAYPLQKKEAW